MSSAFQHPQHLTSADMAMITRVHVKACAKYRIIPDSLDAERVATLLVRNFQYGVKNEADLLAAFTTEGVLRLSVPVGRMDQFIGTALHRWEVEGGSLPH